MTSFSARYDLRCPAFAPWSRQELYATALEQAAFCDASGVDAVVVSEHHAVDDGYLPAPLVMAAAVVARTSRVAVSVAALLVALYDPVRLAEEMVVLDHLSGGRVSYVLALGYRPEEYELHGVPWEGRGARAEEKINRLLAVLDWSSAERSDGSVRVTPAPLTRPRPFLFYGGGTPAAARRAARLGLDFLPQLADPELSECYRQACRESGRAEGMVFEPSPGPGVVFCAERPELFWERCGEHLLHDARSYDSWHGQLRSAVRDGSTTVEEMRRAGVYVVLTPDELVERCRSGELVGVSMSPLCGGLPAEPSWESLRLIGEVVLPAVRGAENGTGQY